MADPAALRGRGAGTWHLAGWLLFAAPLAFALAVAFSAKLAVASGAMPARRAEPV